LYGVRLLKAQTGEGDQGCCDVFDFIHTIYFFIRCGGFTAFALLKSKTLAKSAEARVVRFVFSF